jgi:hypothetical protein
MKFFYCFVSLSLHISALYAQDMVLQPVTEHTLSRVYGADGGHTAMRHQLMSDTGYIHTEGSWLKRKLFHEHLLQYSHNGFNISADFIPDFQIGSSSRKPSGTPWLNTRGARIAGNYRDIFFFEAEDYENQGRFPGYVDSYIQRSRVVPGAQTFRRNDINAPYDYNYAAGRMVYQPLKQLRLELGYGRNFIGDGYRSLLLSDWSFNYPYLKVTTQYRSLQYSVMWSQHIAAIDPGTHATWGYPRKWAQTFFLDWLVGNHGSIGLFESVIWPDVNAHNRKDLSWSMASPLMFVHGTESPSGMANSTLTGLNLRYRLARGYHIYGQLAFSDFLRQGSWQQRFAAQLGLRAHDIAQIPQLNALVEYNRVQPYTYAATNSTVSYTHYHQAMAHPLGAGFSELMFQADYRYKRWYARAQAFYATYRLDSKGSRAPQDIFNALPAHLAPADGTAFHIGWYDIRLAYVLNPATNLRIEAACTLRDEQGGTVSFSDRIFSIGLRGSFRKQFFDF